MAGSGAHRSYFLLDSKGKRIEQHEKPEKIYATRSFSDGLIFSGMGDEPATIGTFGLIESKFSGLERDYPRRLWLAGYKAGLLTLELDG